MKNLSWISLVICLIVVLFQVFNVVNTQQSIIDKQNTLIDMQQEKIDQLESQLNCVSTPASQQVTIQVPQSQPVGASLTKSQDELVSITLPTDFDRWIISDGKRATQAVRFLDQDQQELIMAVLKLRMTLLTPLSQMSIQDMNWVAVDLHDLFKLEERFRLLLSQQFEIKLWEELRTGYFEMSQRSCSKPFEGLRVIYAKRIKLIDQYLMAYKAGHEAALAANSQPDKK